MDKPIDEWKRRFRGMEPKALTHAWATRADDELSWTHECNFHAAVADRLKQIGNLAIDLDDDTRLKLCMQAKSILARLQNHSVMGMGLQSRSVHLSQRLSPRNVVLVLMSLVSLLSSKSSCLFACLPRLAPT